MSEPDWAPLTGFRVAVTSARRADELATLLERRGATVTSAAADIWIDQSQPLVLDGEDVTCMTDLESRASRHRTSQELQ